MWPYVSLLIILLPPVKEVGILYAYSHLCSVVTQHIICCINGGYSECGSSCGRIAHKRRNWNEDIPGKL